MQYYNIRIVKMRHNEKSRTFKIHIREEKYLQILFGNP
jgi:hypothetical protein